MTAADYLTVAGVLLLTVGLALVSIAAAFVVLGVLMLAAGLWSHHSGIVAGRPAEEAPAELEPQREIE